MVIRPTGDARRDWAGSGALILWLGLALLASGCVNFHGRGITELPRHQHGVGDPQFVRSMAHLVGPGLLEGNQVTTLLNGERIFPAMLDAIRSARQTINFETYIYWSGEVGQEFAEALAERARAGVKVHVLIDWIGGRKLDSRQVELMRRAGAWVYRYNPLVFYNLARLNHRDHRKLLVIDGRVGFIGGAGIADFWSGNAESPGHWRETHFRVEGPVVAQMQAAFMDNWMKTTGRVLDGPEYFPELQPAGEHRAHVFTSSPREGAEPVRLMYLLAIAAAQKSIRLAVPYFVPDALMTRHLIEARQRGVHVEVIVPGEWNDTPVAQHASRAKWGKLLQAGVRIYEYQPTMYHCKVMVVDDAWVTAGSANFDNRSFKLSDEANLIVYGPDFAAEQVRIFEADKARSREVTYHAWKHRSLCKRILEKVVMPFRAHL